MAAPGRTSGLTVNRTEDSQYPVPLWRRKDTGSFGQAELGLGWFRAMTHKASLVFNIGDLIDFPLDVGIFDLAVFVVDPYIFNVFPGANFGNYTVDFIP